MAIAEEEIRKAEFAAGKKRDENGLIVDIEPEELEKVAEDLAIEE